MPDHIPTRAEVEQLRHGVAWPDEHYEGVVDRILARLDKAEAVVRDLLEQAGYTRNDASWSTAVRRAYVLLEGANDI